MRYSQGSILDTLNNPFSAADAKEKGISRHFLRKLIAKGQIEQVTHGVYRKSQDDFNAEDDYRAAHLRVGEPSAICLISALAHYNLTDLIPRTTWILVPLKKRSQYQDLRLMRKRDPLWKTGIIRGKGYSITTVERTLVDCLVHHRQVGKGIAIESLRKAIQTKKCSLKKVLDMAIQMKVDHRIRPYIEALS